jgi:hypothetical protein
MARPRAWGLSLIGKRRRFLGFVEATNREEAKTAVVDEFELSHNNASDLWCGSYQEESKPPPYRYSI